MLHNVAAGSVEWLARRGLGEFRSGEELRRAAA